VAFIDLAGLQFAHYLLIGGGALVLLILLLFTIPSVRSGGLRVPAIVVVGLSGVAVGAGAGILLMAGFGYYVTPPEPPANPPVIKGPAAPAPMPGKGGGKGGFAGKGGGGKGPSARAQLASLVTKLDQLTGKGLQLSLNDKERVAVREQLQGLTDKENLDDADARKRLDSVLEALKDHRDTLEAAGYRWPGQGGGGKGGGKDAANPFREEKTGERLKALELRLGGKV
jgi:hypothetical protein